MTRLFSMPGGAEWIIILFLLVIMLIPYVLFLLTLQNTLNAISYENRRMPPANVWLMFIPLFNIVWQFILVTSVADSIKAECERLHIPVTEGRPTAGIGLAWNICSVCFFVPFAPLASLVLWIIYWVKVNEYKNLIIANKDNFLLDAERQIFNTSL